MTTTEALDLALGLLREKCEMDRSAVRIIEARPELALAIDPHTARRYQRHMQAIELLKDLKAREGATITTVTEGVTNEH